MLSLSDANRNWRERWEVIDDIIRSWLRADYTRVPDQSGIEEIEKRIGALLPASFKEWCYFAWAAPQIEDYFILRDEFIVKRLEDHDAISLVLQGEGDYYWAVKSEFWEQEDPPVIGYALDYDTPEELFVEQGKWSPTVSSFALDYLLMYLSSDGGGFSAPMTSPAFEREALIADLGPPTIFGHLEIFTRDGILAYHSQSECWRDDAIKVRIQHNTPLRKLPLSIQHLLRGSSWREGPLVETH